MASVIQQNYRTGSWISCSLTMGYWTLIGVPMVFSLKEGTLVSFHNLFYPTDPRAHWLKIACFDKIHIIIMIINHHHHPHQIPPKKIPCSMAKFKGDSWFIPPNSYLKLVGFIGFGWGNWLWSTSNSCKGALGDGWMGHLRNRSVIPRHPSPSVTIRKYN